MGISLTRREQELRKHTPKHTNVSYPIQMDARMHGARVRVLSEAELPGERNLRRVHIQDASPRKAGGRREGRRAHMKSNRMKMGCG